MTIMVFCKDAELQSQTEILQEGWASIFKRNRRLVGNIRLYRIKPFFSFFESRVLELDTPFVFTLLLEG